MVRASAVGAIDFTANDGSPRWWIGARLKLRAVEDELYLRTMELATQRAIAIQGMTDLGRDTDFRQKHALQAVERFQAAAMPWLGAAKGQNDTDTQLDDVAMWYAVFGKEYGVSG